MRRLSPLQRRVAIEVNNLETTAARLRKVVDDLGRYSEELTADELEDLVRQARGKDRIDRDPVLTDHECNDRCTDPSHGAAAWPP